MFYKIVRYFVCPRDSVPLTDSPLKTPQNSIMAVNIHTASE